jgi:hypothetical protein
LAKWNRLPESSQQSDSSADVKAKHRWEDSYPTDGLVLTCFSRDLPEDGDPGSERLPTWNRDAAWFSKDEAERLIPANAQLGDQFEFPDFFVNRMAKLHFVDMVKGQTDAYQESEIEGSQISGTIVEIEGSEITIDITGTTHGEVDFGLYARSLNTELIGKAVFDRDDKKFRSFEIVAIGARTGRTRFNDRRSQMAATPIGFVFELAEPDAAPVVPGIIWSYDADWIRRQ